VYRKWGYLQAVEDSAKMSMVKATEVKALAHYGHDGEVFLTSFLPSLL